MFPTKEDFEFIPPPEAPVFEPDEEEWKDPLGYIAKIHPYAVKVGICKIRPPPEWQPPFSIDVDKFRFTPRIQKLNELEAKTRVKLNFIDAIAKFWELQGNQVKLPNVEKKPLDIHELHKIVQSEGGFEDVTRLRRWSRIAYLMGYTAAASSSILRRHYEKILYPYDVFMSGAMTGETEPLKSNQEIKEEIEDVDYKPTELGDGNETPPSIAATRKSRYKADDANEVSEEIDYTRNSELKKLQFLSPGPKITGNRRSKKASGKYNKKDYLSDAEFHALTAKASNKKEANIFDMVKTWVDDYRCKVCENGDDEDCMLLCDSCDASYHTFCLIPPLAAVPPGDWRCPKCLARECKKKSEAFGFEQAKKIYALEDFGEMADKFKEDYFAMPPAEVPVRVVEKEFWRLVSSLDDDVAVEYAADLHTADHGSGFPTKINSDLDDEEYINSPWNLNNLPNNEKSILKYITQDISGMKVPWIYVGMCFSSFCWHTEDHWSYSINYHHWGEPKTWYGVPETEAERLEACVRNVAPELFEKNPDLFHHLVTLCSPMTLTNYGVPVVRTNQYPGEFVVTFPRAYHAGFNNGYNCAEAVNFCPADWLVTGQECVLHYQKLRRPTVFSHEELICKMASIPDALDLDLAKKLYDNLRTSVETEVNGRTQLKDRGITDRQKEAFELINDDERQCSYCKTTMFFSAIVCSCNKKKMACLNHASELCGCPDFKKYIRYRYTLEELPQMLANLKKRADSFDNWEKTVQKAVSNQCEEKIELSGLKEFITEAEESQFPDCELLEQLRVFAAEAEQCSQVACQLLTKKHKTRKATTSSSQPAPRLTLNELKDFVAQVHNLPCVIKEAKAIDKLMGQVESFRYDAKLVLNSEDYNEKKVIELLEHADAMDVDLPEINDLRLDLKASKWLESIEEILNQEDPISLDVIRGCVDQGIGLRKKQASEKPLSRLKELLYAADRWEEKAKLCLQAKPRHMMGTLEVIVMEASKVKIVLPNVSALKEALQKAKTWSTKVEKVQNDDYYPYYDILEALVVRGRPIPVRLEQLPQMESQVAAARAWKDRTSRTFVKKGSNKQLMELLRPRKDIGKFERKHKKKKVDKKPDTPNNEKSSSTKSEKKSVELKVEKKSDTKSRDKKEKNKDKSNTDNEKPMKTNADDITDDKKPIGLPVEAMNVDEYVAPDPLTVAQGLKQDETVELTDIREVRQKNRQKLIDENIEGPYCICRKSIEGFMIRCNLCLDWFHTACIYVPKTVHGKPIGKGYTAWSATREVRFLCMLCCRSRRPRLDTILQLLMSLQKLPVRVPEGEALQFLTERAMNWQDRAKQALSDPEIQRVVLEAKSLAEKTLSEKQAVSGAGVTQTSILQRLINVQKIHQIKLEKMTTEETSSSNNTIPVEVKQEESSSTTVVSTDVDMENVILNPTTTEESLKANEPSQSHFETSKPSESTSKTAETVENTTNKEPDAADLECTEEMTSSPVASKPSTSLLENPSVVHLTSADSSRAQSPIDVCTPLENLPSSSGKTAKEMITSNVITMAELSDALLDQLEDLMYEGELLEVCLDEVPLIWAVLQIQRPLMKEQCNVMYAEYRRKLVKERKKQRKRKLEEEKAASQAAKALTADMKIASATGVAAAAAKMNTAKKMKEETHVVDVVTKDELKVTEPINVEETPDEDDCSAKPCLKPLGDEVEWVQCDKCEGWYHCACVRISALDASKIDVYLCPYCDNNPKKKKPVLVKEEPMDVDVQPATQASAAVPIPPAKKISDLSVMAQVAHQIIANQEIIVSSTLSTTPDVPSGIQLPQPQNLDLNSLICLADVSEKIDVALKTEPPPTPKKMQIETKDSITKVSITKDSISTVTT